MPVRKSTALTGTDEKQLLAELARLQKKERQQAADIKRLATSLGHYYAEIERLRDQNTALLQALDCANLDWRAADRLGRQWKRDCLRSRAVNQQLRQHQAAQTVAVSPLPGTVLTLYPN